MRLDNYQNTCSCTYKTKRNNISICPYTCVDVRRYCIPHSNLIVFRVKVQQYSKYTMYKQICTFAINDVINWFKISVYVNN